MQPLEAARQATSLGTEHQSGRHDRGGGGSYALADEEVYRVDVSLPSLGERAAYLLVEGPFRL